MPEMLQLYYRWRYRRAQRATALSLPTQNQNTNSARNRFGSYLSQQTVRGRVDSPADQSRNRKRWAKRIAVLMILLAVCWIVYESAQAIQAWGD